MCPLTILFGFVLGIDIVIRVVQCLRTFLHEIDNSIRHVPLDIRWLMPRSLMLLQSPPDWAEILTYFRGSELQNYFQKILEDNMKAIIKPQYVDHIPKVGGW